LCQPIEGVAMGSAVIKRSVVINARRTSVSLEDEFWDALKEIARTRRATLSEVVSAINADRHQNNLSSAIRLHVLEYYHSTHMY
jgi:predicted DNA-binding ribbon-helix-helix protein